MTDALAHVETGTCRRQHTDCPPHGNANRYCNCGCRCEPCTTAIGRRVLARRREQQLLGAVMPDAIPHGTDNGYSNWACRCDPCTDAHTAYQQARRASGKKT